MASRLQWRLSRLEKSAGAGARVCGTCGHPTDGRCLPLGTFPIKVYGGWEDPPPDLGRDVCPDCGARLVIRVELDRAG